jgi:hypothetical protein
MRKFNGVERHYIHLINSTDRDGRSIVDIFDNDLVGARLTINKQARTAAFIFEIENQVPNDLEAQHIIDRIFELHYKIVLLTNLIKYLEENGLLTSYIPQISPGNVITFGQGDSASLAANRPIDDPKIIESLIKYIDSKLLPSIELRQLERHRFKSVDERKLFWERVTTWIGISIAIVFGIWGIYHSSSLQRELRQEIRILNDSLSNKLGQIANEMPAKDSLNVYSGKKPLHHRKK